MYKILDRLYNENRRLRQTLLWNVVDTHAALERRVIALETALKDIAKQTEPDWNDVFEPIASDGARRIHEQAHAALVAPDGLHAREAVKG